MIIPHVDFESHRKIVNRAIGDPFFVFVDSLLKSVSFVFIARVDKFLDHVVHYDRGTQLFVLYGRAADWANIHIEEVLVYALVAVVVAAVRRSRRYQIVQTNGTLYVVCSKHCTFARKVVLH